MRRKLYVIYDRAAEESGPIYEAKNDAIALRNFSQVVDGKPFSEDQELLCVGEIDHETHEIIVEWPARGVRPSVSLVVDSGEEVLK